MARLTRNSRVGLVFNLTKDTTVTPGRWLLIIALTMSWIAAATNFPWGPKASSALKLVPPEAELGQTTPGVAVCHLAVYPTTCSGPHTILESNPEDSPRLAVLDAWTMLAMDFQPRQLAMLETLE